MKSGFPAWSGTIEILSKACISSFRLTILFVEAQSLTAMRGDQTKSTYDEMDCATTHGILTTIVKLGDLNTVERQNSHAQTDNPTLCDTIVEV